MAKEPNQDSRRRCFTCATMDEHRKLAHLYPEYRRRQREIEYETQRFVARYADEGMFTSIVRIPVVVHIVYNGSSQDFTDAQVKAQIASLNDDFRRMNADAGNVPAPFAPFAADTRIEFALAVRDPNCNATTGITRTPTTRSGFSYAQRDEVKSSTTGGADPWPSDRYLNFWVANLTGGLMGFATFPGTLSSAPQLDGVVITTAAFGVIPAHAPYFDLGRIATHEIGHWLNVLHIWGDDGTACTGSDQCGDTPNQGGPNTIPAPAFPHVSCGNGPNGDMFMNYMDYVENSAMIMFTADQAMRMHATLAVERIGILASDGLVPPTSSSSSASDLWMKDAGDDTGAEPYAGSGLIYLSDDIFVRNQPDGLTYQDHQNPTAEQPNFVYVRVRNRGCPGTGSQSGTLKLYWAKASSSLAWPAPWNGTVTSPALMGGLIGSAPVTVAGGAQHIEAFPWTPPDPSDYAMFLGDKAHFCLLARIETAAAAPFGMTFPETANLADNVAKNNNIVWKNVAIVDTDGPSQFGDVVIGQFDRERKVARYAFEIPAQRGPTIFDWGMLLVELRGKALEPWRRELRGEGFQRLEDGRLLITKAGAWLAPPPLKPGEFGTVHIRFLPNETVPMGARIFELDFTERDARNQLLGGQRFVLKTGIVRGPCLDDRLDTFDGVDWVPVQKGCGCP